MLRTRLRLKKTASGYEGQTLMRRGMSPRGVVQALGLKQDKQLLIAEIMRGVQEVTLQDRYLAVIFT
jgi:hypothetical protein